MRRTFRLDRLPQAAKLVVTAYTGYRLFVNGTKIEEEIGSWARRKNPETFNIAPYLRGGENVVAVWGQVHADLGVVEKRGIALVMSVRDASGATTHIVSDAMWKGSPSEGEGWTHHGFDDAAWSAVSVFGRMGVEPWGSTPVANVGRETEPHRKLAIDLPSPYLTCFDELPDIAYDVKSRGDRRVGWYRFRAPPGVAAVVLGTKAPARVWVDGKPAVVRDGTARVAKPPRGVSTVAVRIEMEPGEYGGAAFPQPIGVELSGSGLIQVGEWKSFALPTYSGLGVYRQTLQIDAAHLRGRTLLDLGQVLVAAEVLVNGKTVGVRLARPFRFDLTEHVRAGANELEVRVANTIAPHYTVTNRVANLGPTASGLLGPVTVQHSLSGSAWIRWARDEVAALRKTLDTSTPDLEAARERWERVAKWPRLPYERSRFKRSIVRTSTPSGVVTGFRFEFLSDVGAVAAPADTAAEPRRPRATAFGAPGGVSGRVVRVDIPDRPEYLALAEVEVFSADKNVARSGKARQSATSVGGLPERAIDGNADGAFEHGSVSHTHNHVGPWWEVDLGAVRPIDRIIVWNRTDGDLEARLRGFFVTVLDAERRTVWQRYVQQPPEPMLELNLREPVPIPVRFVSRLRSRYAGFDRRAIVVETPRALEFGWAKGLTFELPWPEMRERKLFLQVGSTTMPDPIRDLPLSVEMTLGVEPTERTAEERATIATFYRSIAPELEPTRRRSKALSTQLERALERGDE